MSTNKGILKIVNGNVVLYNLQGVPQRYYYNGKDCVRVDWCDSDIESILVQLKNGKNLIISRTCQILRRV